MSNIIKKLNVRVIIPTGKRSCRGAEAERKGRRERGEDVESTDCHDGDDGDDDVSLLLTFSV